MAKRARVKKRKDRRIFKNTADTTKKINVIPKVSRGGIHL